MSISANTGIGWMDPSKEGLIEFYAEGQKICVKEEGSMSSEALDAIVTKIDAYQIVFPQDLIDRVVQVASQSIDDQRTVIQEIKKGRYFELVSILPCIDSKERPIHVSELAEREKVARRSFMVTALYLVFIVTFLTMTCHSDNPYINPRL